MIGEWINAVHTPSPRYSRHLRIIHQNTLITRGKEAHYKDNTVVAFLWLRVEKATG
jgi:hypothetical protein